MPEPSDKARAIARDIAALSPAQQMRLAADLLEAGRAEFAYQVLERARLDLGSKLAIAELKRGRRG